MKTSFDPGYFTEPFLTLCNLYPDRAVYPAEDFRVEWGPIFHRGRLDRSARVLVIGQDPAAHEAIARRILVGEAGQRVQGFLAKLGMTRSYVMVNAFLYGVYTQNGGAKHKNAPGIIEYRNRWLDALLLDSQIEAVVAMGALADDAFHKWRQRHPELAVGFAYEHVTHPTYPESVSGSDKTRLAETTKQLLGSWNAALQRLAPAIHHADVKTPLVLYGDAFTAEEIIRIPSQDLPAGLPAWMRSTASWAVRQGDTPERKRATIVVTAPEDAGSPASR